MFDNCPLDDRARVENRRGVVHTYTCTGDRRPTDTCGISRAQREVVLLGPPMPHSDPCISPARFLFSPLSPSLFPAFPSTLPRFRAARFLIRFSRNFHAATPFVHAATARIRIFQLAPCSLETETSFYLCIVEF